VRAALTRATLELVDHSSSKPEELPSPPDPVAALPMAATDRYPSAASPAKAACPVLSPDLRFCPAGVREDTLDTIRPGAARRPRSAGVEYRMIRPNDGQPPLSRRTDRHVDRVDSVSEYPAVEDAGGRRFRTLLSPCFTRSVRIRDHRFAGS